MGAISGARAFCYGGLRRGSGNPKLTSSKLNTKIFFFFSRKANKTIHFRNDVRGTWRMLNRTAGSFPNDSALEAFLLSLEICESVYPVQCWRRGSDCSWGDICSSLLSAGAFTHTRRHNARLVPETQQYTHYKGSEQETK